MTDVHYVTGGTNGRGSRTHPERTCPALHNSTGRIRRASPREKDELPTCCRCNGEPDKSGEKKDWSYQRALWEAQV